MRLEDFTGLEAGTIVVLAWPGANNGGGVKLARLRGLTRTGLVRLGVGATMGGSYTGKFGSDRSFTPEEVLRVAGPADLRALPGGGEVSL